MPLNHSSPAGCFFGVLAIVPGTITGLGLFGLVKWILLPVDHRHFDAGFWMLVQAALIGGLVTIGLVYWSIRILRNTNFREYDSTKPDTRRLKW